MQKRIVVPWARSSFVLGLVLSLIFLIPTASFPLVLGKIAIYTVCLAVATILFVLGGGIQSLRHERWFLLAFLPFVLPLVSLVSYTTSSDRAVGVLGFSLESDTILFLVLSAYTFAFAAAVFRTRTTARQLLVGVSGGVAIAAVFQYVLIIAGSTLLPLAFFADHSVNLVGKWNDFGLLASLVLVLLLLWSGEARTTQQRLFLYIPAALLFGLLAFVQFPLVWSFVLVGALLCVLWSFFALRSSELSPLERVPWAPLVVVFASGLFLIWGATFNSELSKAFSVSSLEVRPSFSSTLDIVRASHGSSFERFLVGTGPNTFNQDWLQHKPTTVNQSNFWSLDFTVGFSTAVTILATTGALGILAWFVPLLLVLLGVYRAARVVITRPGEQRLLFVSLVVSSVYLWCSTLLYVPSQNVLLLLFALSGAAFGFASTIATSARTVESATATEKEIHSRFARVAYVVAGVLVVLFMVLVSFSIARRFVAEWYALQGGALLQQGDVNGALASAATSRAVEPTGDGLRLAVVAGTTKLQSIAAASSTPDMQTEQQFATVLQDTLQRSQQAFLLDTQDYRTLITIGDLYALLASLKVQSAYQNAGQAYLAAAQYNPTNPQIPLAIARLAATQGDTATVQTYLSRSLTLKPDYTDAILLMVQLDVANKDLPSAIKAAQSAVQSAPGVASIWFELGLLYYTANDTQDAVPVLEQAIKIEPGYANAQYFLGLSYAAQNRTQDAITQFQSLQQSNPDNQEVAFILNNLLAGKAPFAGATSTPQNRAIAPVSR